MASYFTVFTNVGADHMGRYRDRLVPVGDEWLIAHRFVSTDWHARRQPLRSRRMIARAMMQTFPRTPARLH